MANFILNSTSTCRQFSSPFGCSPVVPNHKASSIKCTRTRTFRLRVKVAADEEEEMERPKFQPRRLTPLPSNFGTGGEGKNKKTKPSTPPASVPSNSSSSFVVTPASPIKQAPSPFAAAKPAAKPASPFASAPKTGGSASPFASSSPAKSPFGEAPSKPKARNPFGPSAADIANSMAPVESAGDDGRPWYSKLALPKANQLILVFTFGTIISIMLATFWVVLKLGGVSLNE
mmetsp:Transcript_5172/g.7024  ORF Transcript_5172/g.7024 Transcript_5172/m.7024 type:complete len:231 (-) Transcript_5172:158-850(-)|eukprot:CAMPEP_0196595278 /NCGR_PEP_ID=MMETSP1081-20130531/80686_1 /TAXON_ID=36882 /ORGANISM="Pyramimonas amylifera, Strain CCMP720" /LENGTH=230 /DNA_ID=CAMNT_0041919797 /DNA_START=56 /DNA_END=748 /DNA_ORIENTATION=+